MVEFKVLSERRKYLLEQIGAAADEIRQIDERLAQQPSMKKDCPVFRSWVSAIEKRP